MVVLTSGPTEIYDFFSWYWWSFSIRADKAKESNVIDLPIKIDRLFIWPILHVAEEKTEVINQSIDHRQKNPNAAEQNQTTRADVLL